MPFLSRGSRIGSVSSEEAGAATRVEANSSLIGYCSNPECRSAWIQLFRHRTRPVFEAGWTCSPECTEARLQLAVRRELDNSVEVQERHRHRIPLGLLMIENGWITSQQLRCALEAQREAKDLRIGECLVRQGAADKGLVTRALSLQWGCPVLTPGSRGLAGRGAVLPRLFIHAFGALPLQGPSGRILYLAFEQNLDRALAFSLEKIRGVRVECGIVQSSIFADHLRMVAKQDFPAVQLAEAASRSAAAHVLAKSIERAKPIGSRLVRVHEWLWLRMILKPQSAATEGIERTSDVVCRVGLPID